MEGAQAGPSFLAPRLFHHPRRADSSRAMQSPAVPEPQEGAYVSAPPSDRKLRAVKDAAPDQVASLVARAAEGDRDAFGSLYRTHYEGVFRLVRSRLGTDPEDPVAEVFVRAWAAIPRYRDTGAPFAAWLYGIARHVCADEIKRRTRALSVAEVPDEPRFDQPPEDRMVLAHAIAALPDEQRKVIELKFLAGLTNPEIAATLGISTGAVNAKQWRGLAKLQELLGVEEDE